MNNLEDFEIFEYDDFGSTMSVFKRVMMAIQARGEKPCKTKTTATNAYNETYQ